MAAKARIDYFSSDPKVRRPVSFWVIWLIAFGLLALTAAVALVIFFFSMGKSGVGMP